jgi:hypothetical protein
MCSCYAAFIDASKTDPVLCYAVLAALDDAVAAGIRNTG